MDDEDCCPCFENPYPKPVYSYEVDEINNQIKNTKVNDGDQEYKGNYLTHD